MAIADSGSPAEP